ncbi:peroxisomal biogenesis factor 3 [Dermacentor variabilis]|uniref:peroxisomal biogenesis factor 3 n=1 Tax=Dermacentor variabilis TaxID=34621 RepID=UPI003F5BD958
MFSRLYNAVRQHKKKIFFSVGLVGGAYLLNRYLHGKLRDWETKQTQSYIDQIKHQHHFENILQTSDNTILTLLEKVREPLLAILETDSLLEKLKTRPANRVELWEELKVRILTFAVASVYAESLLASLVRVQLGVVGGYVFVNSQRAQQNSGGVLPALTNQDIHQRYLSQVQHFFENGLHELARVVRDAVVAAFGHISLKERVGPADFAVGFDFVKKHISRDSKKPLPGFLRLLLPPLEVEGDTDDVRVLNVMILETRDILETDDFAKVLGMCIDLGINSLTNDVEVCFKNMRAAAEENASGDRAERSAASTSAVSTGFPMAKLLPVLRNSLVAGRQEGFLKIVLQAEILRSMLANVYEAFCQTEDADRINHNLTPLS